MKFITIFVLAFLGFSCSKVKENPYPKAIGGIVDLSQGKIDQSEFVSDPEKYFEKYGSIPLEGEWEFYWKEFYTSEDFQNPEKKEEIDKKREYMKVPGRIPDRPDMERIGIGYGTYRLLVKGENLERWTHVFIEAIFTAFRVYSNGNLFLEQGKISTNRETGEANFFIKVSKLSNYKDKDLEIILQISNYHLHRIGIISNIYLGSEEVIYKMKEEVLKENYYFLGAFLILSLYHLGLYLIRRTDPSTLHFSILSFILSIRPFFVNKYILDDYPFLTWEFFLKVEYLTVSLSPSFFVLFFRSLYPEVLSRKIPFLFLWTGIFLSALVVVGSSYFVSLILTYLQIFVIISTFTCIWILLKAMHEKKPGSYSFFFTVIIFFITILNDILHQKEIIYTDYYLSYGLFVFIFSQAYLLSVRFSRAFKDSEEQRSLLAQAKQEIENLSRTKDEFLSNLSHEIKTPLSVVYTYSQMLPAQKDNPKKIEKYADQIYANSSKLNDYVSDLLLVTDIESNLELQKTFFSLKQLIEESLSPYSGLLEEKSISLEMSEIPETSLECDPVLLKKAIQAVLKNAIVYNKKEGIVKIGVQIKSDVLNLHITDTGIGIETGQLKKVFEKFWRGNSSLTYEVSGVGVGLFLAKRILELHGGSILVESEIDKGSTFILSVPCENGDF